MKTILWFLAVVALLAGGGPLAAYYVGMHNAQGVPEKPLIQYAPEEALAAWQMRKESLPVSLRPITPWHWYELLWCSVHDDQPADFLTCGNQYPGLRSSGFIAKEYLIDNIKNNGLIWRYLSRTAMTIWITRNWSSKDVAEELVRLGRLGR